MRGLRNDRGMTAAAALTLGRAAFAREQWSEACAQLAAADAHESLDPEDLDRLATAAYLVGKDAESADARGRAHFLFVERGEPIRAARSAFWLAFAMLDKPAHQAQASGWLGRARRLLDESGLECVEHGFLLAALAFRSVGEGQIAQAQECFARAAAIGGRFKDPDLTALARHGEGRVLLRTGRTADGLAVLDEVMVAVTCGEVAPMVAGVVYCSVIGACHDLFDLRRAQEWTTALARWCAQHPDMVPFRGQCLIRRSELLQLHGAWPEAMDEARRACLLADPAGQPEAGAAHYQEAELHRIRGEFERADHAYRRANQAGRTPQPGLALLRLAQGRIEDAAATIGRDLHDTRSPRSRVLMLRAGVDIMVAAGDLAAAERAADELRRIADENGRLSCVPRRRARRVRSRWRRAMRARPSACSAMP